MRPFEDDVDDPVEVLHLWLEEAALSELNDPTAAALATATHSGIPSVRMVLTKGVDQRGVRFFSNQQSQKGQELRENPQASLCFHWKSLRRQVRLTGCVEELAREETTRHFQSRSRRSQIAAAISSQSRPLLRREIMDAAVEAYTLQLGDAEVPLPADWIGYLLVPETIEFWNDGEHRLHDRLCFTRHTDHWTAQRLYP